MHPAAETFFKIVKEVLPEFFRDVTVLDFGSYNVNGSTRSLFECSQYIGIDLTSGPGVDIVANCAEVDLEKQFDVGISSECFEHNPEWLKSFWNLTHHTKPTGLVLFSCAATNRPPHGTKETNPGDSPGTQAVGWNYYRNLSLNDFDFLLDNPVFSSWRLFENPQACDLYFVGMRKNSGLVFEAQRHALDLIWKKLGGYPAIRSRP